MNQDLEQRIRRFIEEEVLATSSWGTLGSTTPLLSGILDSLSIRSVASFLEDEFGMEIEPRDFTPRNFGTIAALAELVRARTGDAPT